MNQDPQGYDWLTYLYFIGLAVWGGIVNFSRKIREGNARPFNLMELIGEIMTSGFAGLLAFYLCESAGMDRLLTAVVVGVAGHMGGRTIALMEQRVTEWMNGRNK